MHVTFTFHEYLPFNPPSTKGTGQNYPFLPRYPGTARGPVVEVCASRPVTWVRFQVGRHFLFFFYLYKNHIYHGQSQFWPINILAF